VRERIVQARKQNLSIYDIQSAFWTTKAIG